MLHLEGRRPQLERDRCPNGVNHIACKESSWQSMLDMMSSSRPAGSTEHSWAWYLKVRVHHCYYYEDILLVSYIDRHYGQ